jgi:hypothetical protein
VISLAGCLDNNSEPKPVVEPSGSADYYISNKSSIDLDVVYTILNSQVDSLKTVPTDSSVKILRDGGFGFNPTPSTSFEKVIFYKDAQDPSKPVLAIHPIKDDKWNIVEKKGFENSDYGFIEYELVVTDNDLN